LHERSRHLRRNVFKLRNLGFRKAKGATDFLVGSRTIAAKRSRGKHSLRQSDGF
jgi:hypothetical protein